MQRYLRTFAQLAERTSAPKVMATSKTYSSDSSKIRVVDAWAQPMEASLLKYVPEVTRLMEQSKSPTLGLTKGMDLDSLDLGTDYLGHLLQDGGVNKVMLSAWQRPGQVVISNERIREYVTKFPDQVCGVGTCDLENPQEAVATVEKCVKEYGFKAIRIIPWLWNRAPTDRYYYPILSKCVELGVPFCTQVGHTGPLLPSEPGRPIPYIDQIAIDFPDLKIVGGHIGYPWTNEMIGCAWKHANVYIDTSAHAPKYYPQELLHFMNSYGKEKVLFGTNFPQLGFKKCVKQALELPIDTDAKENFLWRNADRVFNLGMSDQAATKPSKL